jgi:hypothetical protein
MASNNLRHGYSRVGEVRAEWQAWNHMKQRCYNSNDPFYSDYGGRGIKVCDRWRSSFDAFIEDMKDRPSGCSLDRIDPNGDYSPENCRWADKFIQARNRRTVIIIDHLGQSLCMEEWSRQTGIPRQTIAQRYHKGWPPSEVLKIRHGVGNNTGGNN